VQGVFDIGNLSWLQSLSRSAISTDKTPGTAAAAAAGDDAVVLVNGALVNISSVLQNLHKSEDERAKVENGLMNMEQECGVYRLCSLFLYQNSFAVKLSFWVI